PGPGLDVVDLHRERRAGGDRRVGDRQAGERVDGRRLRRRRRGGRRGRGRRGGGGRLRCRVLLAGDGDDGGGRREHGHGGDPGRRAPPARGGERGPPAGATRAVPGGGAVGPALLAPHRHAGSVPRRGVAAPVTPGGRRPTRR